VTNSSDTRAQLAFFLQVTGDGTWCEDGQFYAELYHNPSLAGDPVSTGCEPLPNWHWHDLHDDYPVQLHGAPGDSDGLTLFSSRWTGRLSVIDGHHQFVFVSDASGGSRIRVDDVCVLDKWDESCASRCESDPITITGGHNKVTYEYRSSTSDNVRVLPERNFAVLAWEYQDPHATSTSHSDSKHQSDATNTTAAPAFNASTVQIETTHFFEDCAWLAGTAGTGVGLGTRWEAGYTVVTDEGQMPFSGAFDRAPMLFATIASINGAPGHLRLVQSDRFGSSVVVEEGVCGIRVEPVRTLAWIAIAPSGTGVADSSADTAAVLRPATVSGEVEALLDIAHVLQLPEYLRWLPASDPCIGNWRGTECRRAEAGSLSSHDAGLA
jgi:hypothetical protein